MVVTNLGQMPSSCLISGAKSSLIFKWHQLLVRLWLEQMHPDTAVLGLQVRCKVIYSFAGWGELKRMWK